MASTDTQSENPRPPAHPPVADDPGLFGTIAWLAPVILYVGHYFARGLMPYDLWKRYVLGELGLTEQLTVILLVAALAVGIHVAWRTLAERDTRLTAFFVIFCLGCVYFAGEEASWGQHWFR